MKTQKPKSLGSTKAVLRGKFSNTGLPQAARKTSNNLTIHLKNQGKHKAHSRSKEVIIIINNKDNKSK